MVSNKAEYLFIQYKDGNTREECRKEFKKKQHVFDKRLRLYLTGDIREEIQTRHPQQLLYLHETVITR